MRRLFENYVEVERDYYRKTGIFPIMHTVVIRREIYEANRWIAQSLFKAFCEAQRRDLPRTSHETAAHEDDAAVAHRACRGGARASWATTSGPTASSKNREALATFLRYSFEQGLSKRLLEPEELFAPETFEAFRI